ncbi:hypothetical protein MMC18_006369 [Xylographa bjoerkii]|nr:hypothetical protein [Xylographa bjoerkii]
MKVAGLTTMVESSSNQLEESTEFTRAQNEKEYTKLLASLKGQTVNIPDLRPIFSGWPYGINPKEDALTKLVTKWVASLPRTGEDKTKFLCKDLPSFGAMLWPRAELRELYTLTCFLGWISLWDDAIDEPRGVHAEDSLDCAKYGKDTKDFLRHCLQVISEEKTPKPSSLKESIKALWFNLSSGRGLNNHYAVPKTLDPITQSFESIGDQIRAAYTIEQRKIFLDEMNIYVDSTMDEQIFRGMYIIAGVDSFWKIRMGSSGDAALTALLDLANNIRVPYAIMKDSEVKILVDETNKIISMTNDLLSLKKEFVNLPENGSKIGQPAGSDPCIMNHIPLAFAEQEHKDLQLVINQAAEFIKTAVHTFDTTASSVLARPRDDPISETHLHDFIQGCRENCTGNLEWSFKTMRYGLRGLRQADGSVSFVFYADAEIIREGPVGDQGDGAYSTGRGGAANIESPQTPGPHKGAAHDVEVIPEQALRRESQVDTHTGRGGAANVHPASSTPTPSGPAIAPREQQNHHVGRGGEGNEQHKSAKHEGAVDALKHLFSGKKK